jgi:hypothetical protein
VEITQYKINLYDVIITIIRKGFFYSSVGVEELA